jgi:hypothetical protein
VNTKFTYIVLYSEFTWKVAQKNISGKLVDWMRLIRQLFELSTPCLFWNFESGYIITDLFLNLMKPLEAKYAYATLSLL